MNSLIVAVDIGNTRIHFGVASGTQADGCPTWELLDSRDTVNFNPESLARILPDGFLEWRVASVHRASESALSSWVSGVRPHDTYRCLRHADLPLDVRLPAPERVGMDRLVAAVAANRIRNSERAAIVVDAGTAVTVDAVAVDGSFQGGVILPGMRLVCRALAAGTDLLPLVEVSFSDSPPEPIGRSTETAIRSGAFWGTVGAIRLLISQFRHQLGDSAQVLVTGGDASSLASLIDADAQFVPQLVLAGIFWSDQ